MAKLTKIKKVNQYKMGMCDQTLLRLEDGKQDNSKYAQDILDQRKRLDAREARRVAGIKAKVFGKVA